MKIAYLLILAAYLILTYITSKQILRSILLTPVQKKANIILNCLVPLLWFYLIRNIIFQETKIMTRDERDRMISEESGSKLGDEIGSSRDARYGL